MTGIVWRYGDGSNNSRLSSGLFFLLAICLPVVLPFVRRATPVFLVFAALCVAIHLVRRGLWLDVIARLKPVPIIVGSSFLIWAGISCLWAPVVGRSFHAVGSGALIFLSGLFLVIYPPERSRHSEMLAALSLSVAAMIVMIDLKTGSMLLNFIHSRPAAYRYNMVLVSLVVLSFSLFNQGLTHTQPLKYFAVILLTGAVSVGESETAKFALLIGYFVMFFSRVVSRVLSRFCFFVGVTSAWMVFLLTPERFSYLARLWPSMAEMGHAAERVHIWIAYSKFSLAGLPWGWGVESVANVSMTSYYATVPDALKSSLEWLHPHNSPIQIAAELGLPGILLGMAGSFYLLVWAHADEHLRPARAGLVSAVIIVALISPGFWQMWWWSTVMVSCYLLTREAYCQQ